MIKISFPAVSRALLALFALTATVSCLPGTMPFDSGGANAAATGGGIGRRTAVPTVASTGLFFNSRPSGYYNRGYGYGYGSRSVCNVCGYNPCRCSRSSHYGHGSHGSSRYTSSSNRSVAAVEKKHDHSSHPHAHDTYRIAGGSLRPTQTKPSGYHSLDWYKSRGYDTSKLTLKNEHGQLKGTAGSKSKSSSSKSKSSSSKSSSRGKKK